MTSSAPYKNILKLYLIMQWIMSDIFLKCPILLACEVHS